MLNRLRKPVPLSVVSAAANAARLNPRPALTLAALWTILKTTLAEANNDKVPLLGAALAFYSMLSIGPLLLITIAIAGMVFGQAAIGGYISDEIRRLTGPASSQAIQSILTNSHGLRGSLTATIIGVITLVISSTGFFAQMQDALNLIWDVQGKPHGKWWFFKKRFLSFLMILGIGVVLMAALVVSAILSMLGVLYAGIFTRFVLHLLNFIISFGVVTVLFAMIFNILPDVTIKWRDVWVGAGMTALLFTFGKFLIALYLGHSALSSTYGAAGSIIVVMIWIYYSTQIFFLGAEFTHVYARYMGATVKLKKGRRKPVEAVIPSGES
ncbi:MAG: YihY/virulence factor BrkB family protein [Asticcacaulis sp.]